MSEPQTLIIKCTHGFEGDSAERTNQALTVAATAAASGHRVQLWLAGEATWLAVPGRADNFALPYATPATELLDTIRELGQLIACGQCAKRRNLTEADLLPGTTIKGAATFIDATLQPQTTALVY